MPSTNDLIAYIALTLIAVNALGLPLVFWLGRRSRKPVNQGGSALIGFNPANPLEGYEPAEEQPEPEPEEDRCKDCTYFDLEEGQSVMNQHPDFKLAAVHLPPAVIGAVIEYEPCPDCPAGIDPPDLPPPPDDPAFKGCDTCRGSGLKRKGPKPTGMPMKARWEDFGACLCEKTFDEKGDGSIVWKEDNCEYWKRKTHLKVVASS
jgi:hypothetical protein